MFQTVPISLISVTFQDPATRSRLYSTFYVGYVRKGASCLVYRWWGQKTAVITDSRDGHVPLLLGVPEQASQVVVPITSEEGIAIKHMLCCSHSHGSSHILLLLLPNALVTFQILLELITTSHDPEARGSLCHLPEVHAYVESPTNRH